MDTKIKQDINIGQTIRSIWKQKRLTQMDVVRQLQLAGLGTTRSS